MKHVFRAQKLGWEKAFDVIWFDTNYYTREEAEAELEPFEGLTQNGYPYSGYEYGGQKYYSYSYLGVYEDDKMPGTISKYIDPLAQ